MRLSDAGHGRKLASPILLVISCVVAIGLAATLGPEAPVGTASADAPVEVRLEPVRAAPPSVADVPLDAGRAWSPTAADVRLDAVRAAPPSAAVERERERIRRHLADAERALVARDVGHLSPDQRRNRERHLAVLREYRERGEFPRNLDFPRERVPYFVDDRGVHCAVGYLIRRDGRKELVERIARTRNNARIAELADDPELIAWLDEAGLSATEAARIQPMYCAWDGSCPPDPAEEPAGRLTTGYAAASVAAAALGGLSVGIDLAGEAGSTQRWVSVLGAASGLAGVGLGMHGIAEGGDARAVGGVNAVLGLVSGYLGARSLLAGPGHESAEPGFDEDEEGDRSQAAPRVSIGPVAPAAGGVGLALTIRH